MFHQIPEDILARMTELEAIDAQDRQDGTPRLKRLRQIPPETGKFLALMAANVPEDGAWLEVGTSAGYSTMWISLTAKARGRKLITFELLKDKVVLAKETIKKAKLKDCVELVNGDARGHVGHYGEIAFCFVDVEKEMYPEIFEMVVPNLVSGGLLLADNATSHAAELEDFIKQAEEDARVDAVVVPIGKGILLCRKV